MRSKLGYLLSGPIRSKGIQGNVANVFHTAAYYEEVLNIEHFCSVELLGISPPNDPLEKSFLNTYEASSINRGYDGAYTAAFSWKKEHPDLPTNLTICKKRTRATARRLHQTPDLLKCYGEIIKEEEIRGFIEKVEDPDSTDRVHYIPHHPVKKESSTTPIRIVYDCSCRQSPSSPSLNDCLEVCTRFLTDMGSMLVRFRNHAVGISTDIEKAFLHVQLDPADRDMTRFLWLSDPDDPESEFQVYRFKSVLFGSATSPFIHNAVLHIHLSYYDTPITRDMKENLYVDNIITGCDYDEDILNYYDKSRSVMADAKFNLRSWASSSQPLCNRAACDKVLDPNSHSANVLALRWDTVANTLTLAHKDTSLSPDTLVTKQEILTESSKIYDPLGLVKPVSVNAKILMQDIWQLSVDWDEPLDGEIGNRWLRIADDIIQSADLTIPRNYFTSYSLSEATQLHVFVDASPKAYGTVTYLGQAEQSSLVMSKHALQLSRN